MVVDIYLNLVVLYRRNLDRRKSFIRLAIFLRRTDFMYIFTYTLNCMCPIIPTLTHIFLQDFD